LYKNLAKIGIILVLYLVLSLLKDK